jgi:hypothetical protein
MSSWTVEPAGSAAPDLVEHFASSCASVNGWTNVDVSVTPARKLGKTEALDHAEQATVELRNLAHGILP